jgi:ring-1,2-phenylacetyl-CoA epoxidase subunit PaaA
LIKWGIKTKTNDELRQEFINEMVADLTAVNLTLPDPDLHFDEASGNWITGPIDWDEFWRVVKGNGPCNKERLAARQEAHDNGRWVREAMAAFAAHSEQVLA